MDPFEVPDSPTEIPAVEGGVWPCVVVGGGAAGLLAGIFAGRGGARTLVLETRKSPGAKIRVSGGARCNVLPSTFAADDLHTGGSANALRKVLASWPLAQVRAFFEQELGIALKVEETGKVFPVSEDPREVVVALLRELARAGGTLVGNARVESLSRASASGAADAGSLGGVLGDSGGAPGGAPGAAGFVLALEGGRVVRARHVVLATGGLSLPKTGSDGRGLEFARALGHGIEPLHPALVPLFAADPAWGELAGLSLPARANVIRDGRVVESRQGDFLFTHRGFSGPVVLDVSWRLTGESGRGARLEIAWLGDAAPAWEELLGRGGRQTVVGVLREHLPRRLAQVLVARAGLPAELALAALSREARKRLFGELAHCELALAGDEGYRTAEVTEGGVPLGELVTSTLESRVVPGLFLAGEIVDVCGRIGGYNFLWAWVSGRKAGESAARAALAAQNE